MKISKFLVVLIVSLYSIFLYAQEEELCGVENLTAAERQALWEAQSNWLAAGNRGLTESITIPIAFHIVHNNGIGNVSDLDIDNQLDVLNATYSNTNFSFSVHIINRVNSPYWSTHNGSGSIESLQMRQTLAINPTEILNFYICDLHPDGPDGYATFPWMYSNEPWQNSVVVKYNTLPDGDHLKWNEGKTGTHEVGHFFGLFHVFEDECDPNSLDDHVTDTPKQFRDTKGCPDPIPDSCPNDPGLDNIHNYMDYSDDYCKYEFTPGQIDRMHQQMLMYRPMMLGIENGVYVSQISESGSLMIGSKIHHYNKSGLVFDEYLIPAPYFELEQDSIETFRGSQELIYNPSEKFYIWKENEYDVDIINHSQFIINVGYNLFTSQFKKTYSGITIKNNIDGFDIGTIGFKDPWLIDYPDPECPKPEPDEYYNRNRGMEPYGPDALLFKNKPSPFTPDYTTNYDGDVHQGVFLNQNPDPNNTSKPYYSVKAPTTFYNQQTGKTHQLYFLGWDYNPDNIGLWYPQSSETAVVFKDDNAELTVKLKGTQLSNEQNAYSNNSQRKTVRTDDGWLHNVYESMGRVWYETSSDNGLTWSLANNGQPLDNGEGKHPSIDYAFFSVSDDYYQVFIVYQEMSGASSKIKVKYFHKVLENPGMIYKYQADVATVSGNYANVSTTPVVGSYSGNFTVLWKNGTGSLYFRSGAVNISSGISMSASYSLTGTNGNSINPAIHSTKTCCTWIKHIAWQENDQIKYSTLNGTTIGTIETPSSNSPYSENRYPSISLANGNPVLSWTVSGMPVAVIIAPKDNSERFTSKAIVRRKGTDWGDYQLAGNDVTYTNNISVSSVQEKTVIVWSEGTTNPKSKWMKRTGSVYGGPCNLSHSGVQTQVITGSDYQYMTSMVFNNTQLPFYFTRTTTNFNQECSAGGELDKITNLSDSVVTYGRAGISNINDISFVFNVGDVIVGDSIVRFTEKPDTLVYSTYEELNQFTRTEDFQLNNSSQFYFSNLYYVLNKELADSSLTEYDNVNFKVELVNSITGQVVGVFDNITYDKNNLEKYDNICYQVNCSGIQPGEYHLRLVTTVNGEADYALANIINETVNLDKRHFQIINYDGSEMPVT